MTLIIIGLLLWSGAHFFKRLAPRLRQRMGDKAKGLVAVGSVLGIVAMVIGYRGAAFIPVWDPPAFLVHVNNLLMVLAFYLFGVGAAKGTLSARIRHPQLTAVKTWAVAHLLVNGDLASLVLFGGMLTWAIVSVVVINRSRPWDYPTEVSVKGDVKALVIGLVLMAIVAGIHAWLGVNPFG
ncbi:MAG: NnrU family protein [Jannaschia sp.]